MRHDSAFEGGEACGKSTQARLLAEDLDALLTFEPGATAVGTAIRSLLLNPSTTALADRTEALLMAADRAQHVSEMVRPALAVGRHVVTDRYLYSSVAYQGHGRGLPPDEVAHLSLWATDGLLPDLVVLLDVDVGEAMRRRRRARPIVSRRRTMASTSVFARGTSRWRAPIQNVGRSWRAPDRSARSRWPCGQ